MLQVNKPFEQKNVHGVLNKTVNLIQLKRRYL